MAEDDASILTGDGGTVRKQQGCAVSAAFSALGIMAKSELRTGQAVSVIILLEKCEVLPKAVNGRNRELDGLGIGDGGDTVCTSDHSVLQCRSAIGFIDLILRKGRIFIFQADPVSKV